MTEKEAVEKTKKAITTYEAMKFVVANTPIKIREVDIEMTAIHSPVIDGMPKIHNNNAHEEKLMHAIELKDIFIERYYAATTFIDWFEPCWLHLSEEDQLILTEFFLGSAQEKEIAVYTVMDKCHVGKTAAYGKKNAALKHLALLLFGLIIEDALD